MKLRKSYQLVQWENKLQNLRIGAVRPTAKQRDYKAGGLFMPLSTSLSLTFLAAVPLIELSRSPVALAVPIKEELVTQASPQQETELTDAPVTVFVRFPTSPAPNSHFLLNVKEIKYDPTNVIPY